MTDSLNSSWGSLSFPIPASDTDLSGLDPARDVLLGLLEAALNSELESAWEMAASGTGMLRPVGDKLPVLDDLDTLRQRKASWPLLSVSRSIEPQQVDEFTLWQNRITSKWTIDYVLGTLDVGDQIRLTDVLAAAAKVIAATLNNGGHKAYATETVVTPTAGQPSVSAKQVLGLRGPDGCGFSTYWISSFICGAAAFSQGGPKYHALTMTMHSTELDSIADEGVAYNGAQATVDGGPVLVIDTAIPLQIGGQP